MTQFSLFGSTALVLSLAFTPAIADVTAKDVWQVWQDQVAATGQMTISGDEAMSGDALVVSNATYNGSFEIEGEEITFSATMPEISFVENGDGTVDVTMPDTYELPLRVSVDGTNVDVTFDVDQTGYKMTASGTPEEIVQEYSAPIIKMEIASFPMADMVGAVVEASILMSGIEGRTVRVDGDMPTVSSESSMAAVVVNAAVTAPEDEGGGSFNLTVSDIKSSISGNVFGGLAADPQMLPEMIAKGFSSTSNGSFGVLAFDFEFQERDDSVEGSGTFGNSEFSVDFSKDGIDYDNKSQAVTFNMLASEFPLPIQLTMQDYQLGLKVPLSKSDDEQEFGLSFLLGDLTVNDMLWGMVDPGAVLSREPVTAAIDISGAGNLFVDLFDPAQLMSAGIPGQLNAVALNELVLKGMGAEVTGEGAFTIDNAQMDPMTGLPTPVGTLSMRAEGINALIDNLISMGLLPEEDAMGARMMMGMFTVTEGDDVLVTEIEAGADGSVSANGQRIK